ncbi:MAG: hypothetical protein FWE71_02210 [Nocardioidaceae bacterium]|nr:hypothetical protein [Nocardioidaceae bacterium]MCL2611599.1 hypothetical protein [Nocardioidaceae bacterium]
MLYALCNYVKVFDDGDGSAMFIGPVEDGAMLEVGYREYDDAPGSSK